MTDVTLFGLPPSTYVRTARMVLENKEVPYTLDVPNFRAPEYRALHPFGKVPAMRHGELTLYETLAITTYVDEAFPGPRLQPEELKGKALMLQWISAINDYFYKTIVGGCINERFVKPMRGMQPDEAAIEAAMPRITDYLGVAERALSATPYLAGEQVSLADMFLAPIVFYFEQTPEGARLFPQMDSLRQWDERMRRVRGYERVNTSLRIAA